MDISRLRREYPVSELRRSTLEENPIDQLQYWIDDAVNADAIEPNAMILCTATKKGRPSSRTVLLKGLTQEGIVFFTNYESRKAQEIAENPRASATFLWLPLARQTIVEGKVEKISEQESKEYFAARPRESRISAFASHQDEVISSRRELDRIFKETEEKFREKEVPLPKHWGGYRLIPDYFEFWQGREHRLHDRFRYRLENHAWIIERLSP